MHGGSAWALAAPAGDRRGPAAVEKDALVPLQRRLPDAVPPRNRAADSSPRNTASVRCTAERPDCLPMRFAPPAAAAESAAAPCLNAPCFPHTGIPRGFGRCVRPPNAYCPARAPSPALPSFPFSISHFAPLNPTPGLPGTPLLGLAFLCGDRRLH